MVIHMIEIIGRVHQMCKFICLKINCSYKDCTVSSAVFIVMPTLVHMPAYIVLLLKNKGKQRKQRKTNMKNKSKQYKFLLLYAISGASDCLCSASTASATWSEQQQLQ